MAPVTLTLGPNTIQPTRPTGFAPSRARRGSIWVPPSDALDLAGETFSPPDSTIIVLLTIGDAQVPIVIQRANVAGMQPAIADNRRRRIG